MRRQFLRFLVVGASNTTITLLAYVGGFLVAAFHPKKRALHDLLAGTYVTHKQRS